MKCIIFIVGKVRKAFTLFVLLLFSISVCSQELHVKSFDIAESDLSAQTQPRKDLNDKNCALVKVGIGLQGVRFEGNIVGKVESKTGEYWVYMPRGSRMLKVKHPNYSPIMVAFSNYGIEKLEDNRTYQLTMNTSNTRQNTQLQALTIRYTPASAMVLIDSKLVKGSKGMVKATLPVGQHSYMVICDGYESEEGMVKLKSSSPSNLQIALFKETQFSDVAESTVVSEFQQASLPITKLSESISSISNVAKPKTNVEVASNTISIQVKSNVFIEMVKVEKGAFLMGAKDGDEMAFDSERPVHQVTLTDDYYIGKYEVTQSLWEIVMGKNPSRLKRANFPVNNVSWDDCQKFIKKLNKMTGKEFRLPTEAEWEFAARGGIKSKGYQYSGGNDISDVGWNSHNSGLYAHGVGTRRPNELGIYDMSGNVFEYCQDWKRNYSASPEINPVGLEKGKLKVVRGGSWGVDGFSCRPSCRYFYYPFVHSIDLGLRLALSE